MPQVTDYHKTIVLKVTQLTSLTHVSSRGVSRAIGASTQDTNFCDSLLEYSLSYSTFKYETILYNPHNLFVVYDELSCTN